VTTSIGAEGIAEADEEALVVVDDPAEFADVVVALLEDGARRTALGERARQLVERRFSWQRVMDDLDRIYAELARVKR
jgi:glycosyltransferase involved in cell wall biosynthesis